MSNGVLGVLQFAIDGVTAQQNATANNLSNAQTPNFLSTSVSFEQSLQHAMSSPGPSTAQVTSVTDSAGAAANGNNVDLGSQLIASEEETLHYSAISQSINAQFRLVSGVSGGSFA